LDRGLDKRQIASFALGDWIRQGQNILLTGPTAVGKTWLACALGQQATRPYGLVFKLLHQTSTATYSSLFRPINRLGLRNIKLVFITSMSSSSL